MILNDVTITYIDGEEDTVSDVKYMDFDERTLTINCIHDLNIEVPMENIDAITIERRWQEAKDIEEWENVRNED
jgi:hypothetical protein